MRPPLYKCFPCPTLTFHGGEASAEKAAAKEAAAGQAAAENAEAEKAAALGLLQPLKAQSLDDADTLCRVTEVVAAYCEEHGADHIADLVERASMLIGTAAAVLPLKWLSCVYMLYGAPPPLDGPPWYGVPGQTQLPPTNHTGAVRPARRAGDSAGERGRSQDSPCEEARRRHIRASVSEPVKEAPAKKAGAKEASATKPAAAKKPAPVKKMIAKKPAAAKKSPAAKKPVAKTAAAKKSPAAKKK